MGIFREASSVTIPLISNWTASMVRLKAKMQLHPTTHINFLALFMLRICSKLMYRMLVLLCGVGELFVHITVEKYIV